MPKRSLALALCRVSSTEQLENNSLNRQRDAVFTAAEKLDVDIPEDGWWSGSVSSKRGTNVNRKDLNEMLERCKRDRRIKYIIVDEPDRFMRSIDEAAFFEVLFRQSGVEVWYASDPELNKGNLASKLLKFTKYLSAEGSNEERQDKSISGQTKALKEGRYPFSPKPGYKRGYERGIQEVHAVRGPALRSALIRIATHVTTPTNALIELNGSDFMEGRAHYKMDKFRKIATDPFYAGIVEINKQVQVRNTNGLHEPLITIDQHLELLRIFNGKAKTQSGPRKNGNPKYPASNLVSCDSCRQTTNGRFVGFDHSNGKPRGPIYEKYRCRACGRYLTREDMHSMIKQEFRDNPITAAGRDDFLKALGIVWKREEQNKTQEMLRIQHRIISLGNEVAQKVEAATDPGNAFIKDDIMNLIQSKKSEISTLEETLDSLKSTANDDWDKFLRFAFDFLNNMGARFLEIPPENRVQCKDAVFPAGFYVNNKNKVYTPEKSELIRLVQSSNGNVVRVTGL